MSRRGMTELWTKRINDYRAGFEPAAFAEVVKTLKALC